MSTLSSLISGGGGALPQIALTQSQTNAFFHRNGCNL